MSGVTYDNGALLAGEAGKQSVWSLHDELRRRRGRPVVPSVVLAQAWRGGPQPMLSRLLRGCVVEPFTEVMARRAGQLIAKAGTADVVDAAVVISAAARRDLVLTSDPDDLGMLVEVLGVPLRLQQV
ncbi:MAG: twitching motility protein PilT [Pseudonocardiaceae bacterium]|nr:twitching motility protein PilT [Pseudonocardiaceae bacterium]